ncbi:MAG TPA: AEC family transporter, partial [Arenibaculum sp.]|nr:AEC family transporter [Arenibaculum sp.]
MHVILDIVLPLFGLILCGFVVGRPPLFGRDATHALTTFVFYLALPALLFRAVTEAGLPSRQDLAILETYYSGLLLVGTVTVIGARLLLRESLTTAAVLGIGATFSNTVQIGIPLVLAAFGPAGLAQLLLIVTVHAAVLIGAYTVLVEMDRAGGAGRPAAVLVSTLSSVVRNPIVLSLLAGLGWSATGLALPEPVDRFVAMLASAGVPCALFSLGMGLVGIR